MRSTGVKTTSIDLVLRNRQRVRSVDLRQLRNIARAVIEDDLRTTPAWIQNRYEIGIHLVAAREMAALNERHLQHAGSTDVITLEYDERERAPEGEAWMFGDIFICVDEAIAQARKFRTTWPREIVRYLIHGLLHLRGYDDSTGAARRVMKREENRRLRQIAASFPLRKLARGPRLAA
jgi:probable rRNA maturation factor